MEASGWGEPDASASTRASTRDAVWTLGRLRDVRALPVLPAGFMGARCDHDKALCQYKLAKAIRACGGSVPSAASGPRKHPR